jgi:hypothetical protein
MKYLRQITYEGKDNLAHSFRDSGHGADIGSILLRAF